MVTISGTGVAVIARRTTLRGITEAEAAVTPRNTDQDTNTTRRMTMIRGTMEAEADAAPRNTEGAIDAIRTMTAIPGTTSGRAVVALQTALSRRQSSPRSKRERQQRAGRKNVEQQRFVQRKGALSTALASRPGRRTRQS